MTWPTRAAAALCALVLAGCAGGQDERLVVAAASDLRPVFAEIGEAFEAAGGDEAVFTFGSSGQLAQQLVEGAPADVFAAADRAFVDTVLDAGRGDATTTTTYAFGRIAIWARADAWGAWGSLEALVDDADVGTIAIANPNHAPYGAAARQALEASGRWDDAEGRIVFGENVADAHRLAATGNADAAVTAVPLAIASADDGRWVLVPETRHGALEQALVVVADDPARAARADRFVAFVTSEPGREVLRRYGLLLPGEDPPEAWER